MNNRVLVGAAAALVVLALGAGGVYVYFFSGFRSSPSQLSLSSPTPAATGSPSTSPTSLAGTWAVASGSVAGYRVKELFAGQAAKHEAVARTSTVSGGATVSGDSNGYTASALTLTVGLTDLHSVDTVAGRDVTQRDGVVSRQLDVQSFPTATFTAATVPVPGDVAGRQVDVTVAGKLTIHGVTRDVTAKAKAQVVGGKIEIAGSLAIAMSDYQVSPPQAPFVTVDPAVTLEFDFFLAKAA